MNEKLKRSILFVKNVMTERVTERVSAEVKRMMLEELNEHIKLLEKSL
jgi:hypothetical protein